MTSRRLGLRRIWVEAGLVGAMFVRAVEIDLNEIDEWWPIPGSLLLVAFPDPPRLPGNAGVISIACGLGRL